MAFSASTCLSGLGSTTLGPTLTIYSNPIPPNNQGVFVGNVATSLITGNACPYTFVVPDGTTTIRLFDPVSFCYADIPVSNNNICSTCDLNFASLSTNLLSTINVGTLTGNCDTTITDYRISWYGPNSPTTLAFTSGQGTIWPVRDATHPITPSSSDAPFLQAGNYISKITEVEVNGVRFAYTGGTNNVLSPSLLNCSTGTTVSSFTCSNGNYAGPYYKHYREYITDGSSVPQSLTSTFSLSAGTESFIWSFQGLSIYDTLKLTFSGSSYSEPIVLEQIKLGTDAFPADLLPTTFPKVFNDSNEFKKVTRLTNLIVNNNDTILINVTPNQIINTTTWKLKFGCYGTPTASKTCLDTYKDKPYKIERSSIAYDNTDPCGNVIISFNVSGCSTNDNSSFFNSDLVNLTTSVTGADSVNTVTPTNLLKLTYPTFYPSRLYINTTASQTTPICLNSGLNTITSSKSNPNTMDFFFSNLSDLQAYKNSFDTQVATAKSLGGINYVNDPTNINYYRFILLYLTTNPGVFYCGDGLSTSGYYLHCNSAVTTGTTSGGYTMTIQTPFLTNQYVCPNPCVQDCPSRFDQYIGLHNSTRNSIFSNTSTTGLRYNNPFFYSISFKLETSSANISQTKSGSIAQKPKYSTNTYASSGITNTLIPSLSATSWDWQNHFMEVNPTSTTPSYSQTVYQYKVEIVTFVPLRFQIFAAPISNFSTSGVYVTTPIYDSDTPLSFNSTYVY